MILRVEHADFSYIKEKKLIEDLSLEIRSGDLVAVLGPNGSGKTTLLKCIMGFLKWQKGSASVDGEDIRSMPSDRFWEKIAYVPQARGSFTSLTAEEMILLGTTGRIGVFSTPGKEEYAEAHAIAASLGIAHLLDRKCSEMSGGEVQMVLIARALAAKPELLILDEPESNLDFRNQLIVLDTLSRLASEGIAVLFNTHYPEHALSRANRSLLLARGGKSLFGETAEIVTVGNIEKTFGVTSLISEVETGEKSYRNIIPIRLTDKKSAADEEDTPVIAVLSVIFEGNALGERINAILHDAENMIIGRMGLPCEGGLHVINVTLDAGEKAAESLCQRLRVLPGVSAKLTTSKKGKV